MTGEPWDRIYTVNGYHDGPQLGVAEYQGKPHIYQKQFDADADEYTNQFLLSEIEPALLALVLEDWEIWLRWNVAYRQGQVSVDTHPALPDERPRHNELKKLIGDRLKPDLSHSVIKWARFNDQQTEVQWLDLPGKISN